MVTNNFAGAALKGYLPVVVTPYSEMETIREVVAQYLVAAELLYFACVTKSSAD